MTGEFARFLSAGVLAVGIGQAIMAMGHPMLPGMQGFPLAGTSLILLLLSLAGIHPVVGIMAIGSALPSGHSGDLMGSTLLLGWGLGIVAGPLSGLNLALRSCYRTGSRALLRRQLPHVLVMTTVALLLLWLYGALLME